MSMGTLTVFATAEWNGFDDCPSRETYLSQLSQYLSTPITCTYTGFNIFDDPQKCPGDVGVADNPFAVSNCVWAGGNEGDHANTCSQGNCNAGECCPGAGGCNCNCPGCCDSVGGESLQALYCGCGDSATPCGELCFRYAQARVSFQATGTGINYTYFVEHVGFACPADINCPNRGGQSARITAFRDNVYAAEFAAVGLGVQSLGSNQAAVCAAIRSGAAGMINSIPDPGNPGLVWTLGIN